MTVNGVASLCMARLMLYPNRTYPPPFAPEKEDDDKEPASGDDKSTKPRLAKSRSRRTQAPPLPDVLQPLDLSSSRRRAALGGRRIVGSVPAAKVVSLATLNQANSAARMDSDQLHQARRPLSHVLSYGLERMCASRASTTSTVTTGIRNMPLPWSESSSWTAISMVMSVAGSPTPRSPSSSCPGPPRRWSGPIRDSAAA